MTEPVPDWFEKLWCEAWEEVGPGLERKLQQLASAAARNDVDGTRRAFNAAIDFAIEQGPEGEAFLRCWREGDWFSIAADWPEFDLATTGDPLAIEIGQRLAPGTPGNGWQVENTVVGWRCRWQRGEAWCSVPLDQYGRVRSLSQTGCEIHLGDIQQIAEQLRTRRLIHRHGWRGSEERRRVTQEVADALNAAGILPVPQKPEDSA